MLAYARTLSYEFVWDDVLLVARSQRLREWSSLPAVLGSHFWSEVHEGSHYYRPLVSLSFFLDLQLWGLNPLGFHLTNLLAHLATALAVLALARRLSGDTLAAAIAGLAFALHPIHTESVTFISGRTDVLATLFFLLSLLGYARWREGGGALAAGRLALGLLPRSDREGSGGDAARGPRALRLAGGATARGSRGLCARPRPGALSPRTAA